MGASFNTRENRAFGEEIVDTYGMLDDAVDWIKENLEPEDVFDDEVLGTWAESNGFVKKDGED